MELEKLYNEETVRAVREFIVDFQAIFPGLLSVEELVKRITTNMHHNIDFNADLDEKHMGEYCGNKVYISKAVKEKGQTIFHEMIHVITDGVFVREFPFRNFIEGLTTLAEELYVKYKNIKMPKFRRNVNGYVPTFVRQLNFVKDGQLLRKFIKEPDKIYELFYQIGYDKKYYERELRVFARRNEAITVMAKQKEADQDIGPIIKEIEEEILEQYVISIVIGKERFNSKKFLELYEMQMYPNIVRYINILSELIRDKKISKKDISKCGKLGIIYLLGTNDAVDVKNMDVDISEFNDNEVEWLASKVFGFSEYIYNSLDLIDEGIDVDKLYDERDYYIEVMSIYKQLIEEVVNGGLELESIKDCRLRRSKVQGRSYTVHEYLLNAEKSEEEKLLDFILGVEEDRIGDYCLEDDGGIKVVKSGEFFYYPTDSVSFLMHVLMCGAEHSETLYNYLEKYSDCGVVYIDQAIDYDLNDFGDCDINFFVQRGNDLLKVRLSLVNGMISEVVSPMTFIEDGRSIFEKDTKEKLRIKEEHF